MVCAWSTRIVGLGLSPKSDIYLISMKSTPLSLINIYFIKSSYI